MPVRLLIALLGVGLNPLWQGRMQGPLQGQPGSREAMFLPLDRHGSPTVMPSPSFPTPSLIWTGSSPLANALNAAQTFVATGAPAAVGAPFCPGGDYSGVDEMDGRCGTARRFGAGKYYTGGGAYADINSGSLSVCALTRRDNSGPDQREALQLSAAPRGWQLYFTANHGMFGVAGDTNNEANKATTSVGWVVHCGTASIANGLYSYINGTPGGNAAYPAGSTSSGAAALTISALGSPQLGDIAYVWIWNGVELTAAQVKVFSQYILGLLGSRGEVAMFTNTGPVGYWVDGQISVASDDLPLIGASIPPGATGAGSYGGYFAHPSVTNSALQSRVLTSSWTEFGSGVIGTSTAQWFRDGRQLYKITDDSAAQYEGIWQNINKGGAATVIAVIDAATESGASTITIGLQEQTGGGCSSPAETLTTCDLTTAVKRCTATRTFTDANCTQIKLAVYACGAGAASTGHAAITAQAFLGISDAPSLYCETTTTAQSCGADALSYAGLAAPIFSATGTIVGTERYTFDWMPMAAPTLAAQSIILRVDNGAALRHHIELLPGPNQLGWYSEGGADVLAQISFTAGTARRIDMSVNYDRDVYLMRVDGATFVSSTAALNSVAGLSRIQVGTNGGASQFPGGAAIKNVRISR